MKVFMLVKCFIYFKPDFNVWKNIHFLLNESQNKKMRKNQGLFIATFQRLEIRPDNMKRRCSVCVSQRSPKVSDGFKPTEIP